MPDMQEPRHVFDAAWRLPRGGGVPRLRNDHEPPDGPLEYVSDVYAERAADAPTTRPTRSFDRGIGGAMISFVRVGPRVMREGNPRCTGWRRARRGIRYRPASRVPTVTHSEPETDCRR